MLRLNMLVPNSCAYKKLEKIKVKCRRPIERENTGYVFFKKLKWSLREQSWNLGWSTPVRAAVCYSACQKLSTTFKLLKSFFLFDMTFSYFAKCYGYIMPYLVKSIFHVFSSVKNLSFDMLIVTQLLVWRHIESFSLVLHL